MSATDLKIEIADQQSLEIECDPLIDIASAILNDHGVLHGELSIALVDDPAIKELNFKYLQHNWETDVISFVLEEDDTSLVGQLIVSTETAQRVAAELKSSMASELALYVAHGTLHLVGLDDLDESSAKEMRAAEQKYLSQFSIECSNREV